MGDRPVVLVTRKLPAAVEARLARDYEARLNPEDRLYSKDALVEAARGAQAILPCHTEHFPAEVFERLPGSVRILGILGMGRVGQVVAKRARGFEMTILYHDLRRLPPEQEQGAVFHATLEEMLPQCDFLSLHCNVTPATRGLMNAQRFSLLPDGAILVNAARGAIVDDDALVEALRSGTLRAAGIDAYNNEPHVDPRFVALPNTFLMPHIGSATAETRDAMGFRALDNLDAYFAGREPRDRVA